MKKTITDSALALKVIATLYAQGLINTATYNNVVRSYSPPGGLGNERKAA